MAYNARNFLQKVIEIQNIVLREKESGYLNQKEIYWQFIEPVYHISFRTYQEYLGRNAKRELAKLNELKTKKAGL